MENLERKRIQNVKISYWIKDWQEKNPYCEENGLENHNAKFNSEFKTFLNGSGFDEDVIKVFL